jgi:hypothetical protein
VHDSLIRLMERGEIQVSDRRAFSGYIGRVMRSVLIDHVVSCARKSVVAARSASRSSMASKVTASTMNSSWH